MLDSSINRDFTNIHILMSIDEASEDGNISSTFLESGLMRQAVNE